MDLHKFLEGETPKGWIQAAIQQLPLLLLDHANCEIKAALAATAIIHRYPDNHQSQVLSRLAREEFSHFEKVLQMMSHYHISYRKLSASRYAKTMLDHVSNEEPLRKLDTFIINAFIEARSCERFEKLYPHLEPTLSKFYKQLFQAEKRHFMIYLDLASQQGANAELESRIDKFRKLESELILSTDTHFRFHSGVPSSSTVQMDVEYKG